MADYAGTSATLTAVNQHMPPGFKQFLPLPFTPPNDFYPDSRNRLPVLPAISPNPATVLHPSHDAGGHGARADQTARRGPQVASGQHRTPYDRCGDSCVRPRARFTV